MSERSELRSRREERMENGVKNPIGSQAICQKLCYSWDLKHFVLQFDFCLIHI
jgi:hypothetical protein